MAKKRKSKRMATGVKVGLGALGVLLILAAVLVIQQTALPRDPDCVFNQTTTTCLYNVTLPQDRAAVSYQFLMNFDKRSAGEFGPLEDAPRLHTAETDEEDTYDEETYHWYLYGVPESFIGKDAAAIKVSTYSKTRAYCNSEGEELDWDAKNYVVTIPWGNQIKIGDDADTDRYPQNYIIEEDKDRDGDYYTSTHNLWVGGSIGLADCYSSRSKPIEDVTLEKTLESVFPLERLQVDQSKQRFVILLREEEDNEGGSGYILAGPTVQMALMPATYPTDVQYHVGTRFIETLSGEQRTNYTTLDVADQINDACNRGRNGDECTFQLKLTSTTPGAVWIDEENVVLKLAETAPDDPDDPVDPDEPGEPMSGTTKFLIGAGVALAVLVAAMVVSVRRKKKGGKRK